MARTLLTRNRFDTEGGEAHEVNILVHERVQIRYVFLPLSYHGMETTAKRKNKTDH